MEFQGFQNVLPIWFIAILAILFIGLTWYSYFVKHQLTTPVKALLMSIRGIAVLILLLLLLNPFFYSSTNVDIPSKLVVFLDDSESIALTKNDYRGLDSYRKVLNELSLEKQNNFETVFYSVGSDIKPSSPDSILGTASQTNLSAISDHILELDAQTKAAILITDGIYTFGKDPSFSLSNSPIPLYSIALGDTSKVKDISVSNVITNNTGYTNTTQNITSKIRQNGYDGLTRTIELLRDGQVLDSREISFNAVSQVLQIQFEVELAEEGLQQYSIYTEPVNDEWTAENNEKIFSIDVQDSRIAVLHLSFSVHPDVKTIRRILSKDQNIELTPLTWIGNGRFVEQIPVDSTFDVMLISGYPPSGFNNTFLNSLTQLPTLFFALPGSGNNSTIFLEDILLIDSQGTRSIPITIKPELRSEEQPILELPDIDTSILPPLFSTSQSRSVYPQSTPLFTSLYQGTETNSTVIDVLELGNIRRAHVNAWSWYRLVQSDNVNHREYAEQLITNLYSWVASNPESDRLNIYPIKQSFDTDENPVLNASLQNESGNPESAAIIEVIIFTPQGEQRTFNMDNNGDGNYQLKLPNLSRGVYKFEAYARKGNRLIATKKGEFLVTDSNEELNNTIRNDALLQNISANSGGTFFTFADLTGFYQALEKSGVMENHTEVKEQYSYPIQSSVWFVIVMILLSSEWLLRKYYSLP